MIFYKLFNIQFGKDLFSFSFLPLIILTLQFIMNFFLLNNILLLILPNFCKILQKFLNHQNFQKFVNH